MRTTHKALSLAAILASVSTGAVMAQDAKTTDVPTSLEDSRLVEGNDVKSVETFTKEEPITESAEESLRADTGASTTTEVDATASADIPASLDASRLADVKDIEAMNNDGEMYIWSMSDVDGVAPWSDDDAVEMRQAILGNTMVKSQLEAEGYTEQDVVAAYARADGGLTIVVDG